MAGFDSALQEIDNILADAHRAPGMKDIKDRVRLVVDVRGRVLKQFAELYDCLATDPRIAAHPEQAAAIRERLSEVRKNLAGLQAKWRASEMIADFESYARESTPVAQAAKDFVTWAQRARLAA